MYSLDPHEGVVELWIYRLQVFEGQRLVQDTLVKRQWETSVDELSVEKSLRDRSACSLIIVHIPQVAVQEYPSLYGTKP